MTVVSFTWLAWLVSTVALYWLFSNRYRTYVLIGLTVAFLVSADPLSALLLGILTCLTYAAAAKSVSSRVLIPASIAVVVVILAVFKLRVSSDPVNLIGNIAMPLGLSYYSFRLIHYLIERARGTLPEHDFTDYVSYLFFLPTILVGPIHRFREFQADRQAITWRAEDISGGAERILVGYFKIAVLGNYALAKMAVLVGGLGPELKPLYLYLEAVRGSLLLYILFSGYSDVAVGFARMLGFHVMENFNWPFLQRTIGDFWRNWHISLTSWSREYVFVTVVGLTRNPVVGTLTSLIVIGIWHELSARYVAWGLYHGFGIVAVAQWQKWERRRRGPARHKIRSKAPAQSNFRRATNSLKILATANYVFFGYIIISSDSVSDMMQKYYTILLSWWI